MWWFPRAAVHVDDAGLADAPALADLHGRAFAQEWSADEVAGLLASAGVFCLVARRANLLGTRRPVGFVMVREAAGEAEILTIAVDPAQRGRGIGRLLLDAVKRRLFFDSIDALFLEVDAANAAALALYRRLGFREVGRRAGYYSKAQGNGAALVLRLDLG